MILVVESLKIFALSLKGRIAWKPLPPKELAVIGVIEVFDDTVSPRLFDRNEYRRNAVEKA